MAATTRLCLSVLTVGTPERTVQSIAQTHHTDVHHVTSIHDTPS